MSYQPQFTITTSPLARAESIAALRERIQSATVQVPWIPALQKDTRARNTHSSTAIEGNPLTLEEVRALEEGTIVAAPVRAALERLNPALPPEAITAAMDELSRDRLAMLQHPIQNLRRTRNLRLPRLLSGQAALPHPASPKGRGEELVSAKGAGN
jgi:Fic family protein